MIIGQSECLKNETIVKIYDENDKLIQTVHNVTALPGRIATFEKTFLNREGTPFRKEHHFSLKEILEYQNGAAVPAGSSKPAINVTRKNQGVSQIINHGVLDSPDSGTDTFTKYYDREVNWFCVGNWGVFTTPPIQVAKPKNHETRLYNMIPFLCVPESSAVGNWDDMYRNKYAMRRLEKINGVNYYCYYLKKISTVGDSNQKKVMLTKSDGVAYDLGGPNNRNSAWHNSDQPWGGSGGPAGESPLVNTAIYTFVDYELRIDPEDFKDYFKVSGNGSLDLSHFITEAGLVLANNVVVDNNDNIITSTTGRPEVQNAELYSKIVHAPIYMDTEFKAARLQYSIYCS